MNDAERIIAIKDLTGLKWSALARRIKIKSAQTFVDIRNGRHGISPLVAQRISEAFPEFNPEWIKTGEGEMLRSADELPVVEMNCGTDTIGKVSVGSLFSGAELVMRNVSDSMVEFPSGCLLVLRKITDSKLLIPGTIYVIETSEFCVARRYQTGKTADTLTLYATNKATYTDNRQIYEPFEVAHSAVKNVFSILGYIFTKTAEFTSVDK